MIFDEEGGESWPWGLWIARCLRECKPRPQKLKPELTVLLESQGIAEALWAAWRGLGDLDEPGEEEPILLACDVDFARTVAQRVYDMAFPRRAVRRIKRLRLREDRISATITSRIRNRRAQTWRRKNQS